MKLPFLLRLTLPYHIIMNIFHHSAVFWRGKIKTKIMLTLYNELIMVFNHVSTTLVIPKTSVVDTVWYIYIWEALWQVGICILALGREGRGRKRREERGERSRQHNYTLMVLMRWVMMVRQPVHAQNMQNSIFLCPKFSPACFVPYFKLSWLS